MNISDEQLSAYLDGELTLDLRDELERELRNNSELAQRLIQFQESDQIFKHAYQAISDKPVPQAILDLLEPKPARPEARSTTNLNLAKLFDKAHWFPLAAAASLALAIGIGIGFQLPAGDSTPALTAGVLAEDNAVSDLLESGSGAETRLIRNQPRLSVTPVLTFRTAEGSYCREFTALSEDQGLRGLACREDARWTIHMLVPDPSVNPGDSNFRTASVAIVESFEDYVDALIAEPPLDANTENSLITNRWQP